MTPLFFSPRAAAKYQSCLSRSFPSLIPFSIQHFSIARLCNRDHVWNLRLSPVRSHPLRMNMDLLLVALEGQGMGIMTPP